MTELRSCPVQVLVGLGQFYVIRGLITSGICAIKINKRENDMAYLSGRTSSGLHLLEMITSPAWAVAAAC